MFEAPYLTTRKRKGGQRVAYTTSISGGPRSDDFDSAFPAATRSERGALILLT